MRLAASYYDDPMSVEETLRRAGIEQLANRPYGKLSGGQKRQAQFAVAICGRPKVLFLDEPTVGLDVQAREALWTSVRRLLADGCSVVLTTHYLEEAEALADRIAVITKGRVIASGSVDDMRALVARRQISCESQLTAGGGAHLARRRRRAADAGTPADHGHRRRGRGAAPARRRPDARQTRGAPGRTQRSIQRTHTGGCMNALALKSIVAVSPPARGRALGAYLTETQYELTRMIRNPGVAIPVLVLPCALYALFALLIAGEAIDKDPNLGIFLFTAFSIMAVTMPALFGTGVTLALERDMGLLRLKRAQPAPPAAWVVAKIASGLVLAVLAYAPIVVMALATGKLSLGAGQVAALSAAFMLGTIPFCAMGLMIGSLASGTAAPAYANLIYLPGCYLSGMFFPHARVDVLADADLAAVPRQAARHASRGHHQQPVRIAADGDRRHAGLHRAVRRRHDLAPETEGMKWGHSPFPSKRGRTSSNGRPQSR